MSASKVSRNSGYDTEALAYQDSADGSIALRPRSAAEALENLDQTVRRGEVSPLAALATGLQPLDRYLDGGFRPGELVLVGGAQGVGKTTMTLQMARNLVAQTQATCGYVCYEHDETFLLQRLISLESLLGQGKVNADGLPVTHLRDLLVSAGRGADLGEVGLEEALMDHPSASLALARIQSYGQRLYLLKASGSTTDVPSLRDLVREWKDRHGPRVVLFVDYMQKVPALPDPVDEAERVTIVANELKELALSESVPVVGIVAADREGLRAQRLRIHHLRGSSSLMYESDVVLILNNKYRIIAKHSITYNVHRAQEFRNWIVCTVEKNRAGRDLIDLEFRAFFEYAALDPTGGLVTDQLIDERIHED